MMDASAVRIQGQLRTAYWAMLNQSVAPSECFSFLAQKMRWATYPPPPGSAPGYQLAHQLSPTKAQKRVKGIQAECAPGMKSKMEPVPPCAARWVASTAPSLVIKASIPPTARTA